MYTTHYVRTAGARATVTGRERAPSSVRRCGREETCARFSGARSIRDWSSLSRTVETDKRFVVTKLSHTALGYLCRLFGVRYKRNAAETANEQLPGPRTSLEDPAGAQVDSARFKERASDPSPHPRTCVGSLLFRASTRRKSELLKNTVVERFGKTTRVVYSS